MHQVTPETREVVRRGEEIYARAIKPKLVPQDEDQFLAIDVDSEDYDLDADDWTACEKVKRRRPGARLYLMRVGHPAAHSLGFRAAGREGP